MFPITKHANILIDDFFEGIIFRVVESPMLCLCLIDKVKFLKCFLSQNLQISPLIVFLDTPFPKLSESKVVLPISSGLRKRVSQSARWLLSRSKRDRKQTKCCRLCVSVERSLGKLDKKYFCMKLHLIFVFVEISFQQNWIAKTCFTVTVGLRKRVSQSLNCENWFHSHLDLDCENVFRSHLDCENWFHSQFTFVRKYLRIHCSGDKLGCLFVIVMTNTHSNEVNDASARGRGVIWP